MIMKSCVRAFAKLKYQFCVSKLEAELNKIEQVEFKESYLTFQREWKELCNQVRFEPSRVYNDKLSAVQQQKIDLLERHIEKLGLYETRYLVELIKQRSTKKYKFDKLNMGISEEELSVISEGIWPVAHPRWIQQQEMMAKLWPLGQQGLATTFAQHVGFGGGSGGVGGNGQSGEAEAQESKKEEKQEVKAEKLSYDIELSGIDAAQKIKIIKEVRSIFNLGLKEAKELVEKAPTTLQKSVKKEEAEELKTKLEGLGCTINLI